MRWTATTLVVALLGAPVLEAKAAEAPTTPVAGYCEWTHDPVLAELSVLVDDADCASAAQVTEDPHIQTAVLQTPLFEGPRGFGEPSGVHTQVAVFHLKAPYVEPEKSDAAQPSFFWEQYQSFKEAMHAYSTFADQVGERAGELNATYVAIGPEWAKNLNAAAVNTTVEVAFGIVAIGPNLVLLPEAAWNAVPQIGSGASKVHEGVTTGHYDLAAKGVAEVCGGVGVLASVAIPLLKVGMPRTTPISIGAKAAPISSAVAKAQPILRFSQGTASPKFGAKGSFSGRTVFEVADQLRTGKMSPADVPVDNVRDGNALILNTRSALALKQAAIPQSKWTLIDRTGDLALEKVLTDRLQHNNLSSTGTDTLRVTGLGKNASSYQ